MSYSNDNSTLEPRTSKLPSGIFNIDKPAGLTSHDVVARIRRLLRTSGESPPDEYSSSRIRVSRIRVGHAGTLDPMATGVLPVVAGTATRLVEYLAGADKAYRATIVLGGTSTTYDREGEVTSRAGVSMPSLAELQAALVSFKGEIEQLPPMHSAVKTGGKKLYELARAGLEIERVPRRVTISRLDIEAYNPPTLQLFVECSKGTYIRSLAHDLGATLGTGAYLDALIRTRHGSFGLEGAISLEGVEAAFREGTWREILSPPEFILQGWKRHAATPGEERDIRYGKPIGLPSPADSERPMLVAETQAGELLAILYWRVEEGFWHPQKVFNQGE